MSSRFKYLILSISLLLALPSFSLGQSKDPKRELKRLNAKIDRVRVMVDSLELDNQILLPELMSAFKQAVKSKAQQDSITLVILKRINTLSNKIVNLENQSKYMDSTALEIFNKLVLVENKIVNSVNFQTNKVNLVPKLLTTIDTDLRKIVEIQKINLDVTQQNKELFLSFYRDGQLSKFRSNAVLLILFLNFFVSALALIL